MQHASTSRRILTSDYQNLTSFSAHSSFFFLKNSWGNRRWLMWESYFLLKMTRWMNIYIHIWSWKLLEFGRFTYVSTWWAWMQHVSTSIFVGFNNLLLFPHTNCLLIFYLYFLFIFFSGICYNYITFFFNKLWCFDFNFLLDWGQNRRIWQLKLQYHKN